MYLMNLLTADLTAKLYHDSTLVAQKFDNNIWDVMMKAIILRHLKKYITFALEDNGVDIFHEVFIFSVYLFLVCFMFLLFD